VDHNLTWPPKSGSLEWQVCNDFMVLAGIVAVFPLVKYLRDLLLRGNFKGELQMGSLLWIFPICL